MLQDLRGGLAPGSASVNKCLRFKKETCIYAGDCPVTCYAVGSHRFSLSGPEGRSLCGPGKFPSALPVPSAPPFLHKWGQADAPVVPGVPYSSCQLGLASFGTPLFCPTSHGVLPVTQVHIATRRLSLHPQVPTSLFGQLMDERGRIVGNLAKGGRSSMGFL